jgi:Protein kinase domain
MPGALTSANTRLVAIRSLTVTEYLIANARERYIAAAIPSSSFFERGVGLVEGLKPGDPQRVGRYRLLKRLGTGAMGQVYLGQSPSGRLVAVKIIRTELADNTSFRLRFSQEVKAARRVSGIFTAPVVDANPDAPQPWMVTAFVSGPSLSEAVATRGPMPVSTVLMLAAGLAEGLGAVHAAGVVHRDLKPSNVLLARDGPRIIDFGISRSAGSMGPTQAGGIIGSPGFMSPEQAMGEPVGPPADIFSLGSVLAYAATGEPPFGEGPPSALLYRAVHGEPAIRDLPPELRPLVARCLLPDPAARPTTDELLGELGEATPTQGWLDWLDSGEAPAWEGLNTVPSAAWGHVGAMIDLAADQMPAAADYDVLPSVGAPADPAWVPAHAGEEPDYAAAGTGWQESPHAHTTAADAPLAPSPASSLSWVFPEPGGAPSRAAVQRFRRDRTRRRASVAAVGALGVVIVGALAIWLVPRLDPDPPAAGATAPPASHSTGAGRSAQPTSPPQEDTVGTSATSGLTPTEIQALPAVEAAEVRIVQAYFAAINSRHLKVAWQLGGDNLYPTTSAGIAAYADVKHLDVTILGVSGAVVVARIRTIYLTGAVSVHRQDFTVMNGLIVASEPVS